jgi:hypothetical protein
LIKQELTCGREEEICTTYDFRDAYGMIVGDHS